MSGIDSILGLFSALQSADVAVDEARCVAVRNRNASCRKCALACTGGAISLDEEGAFSIDAQKCVGCGTCATVCPTGALSALHPNDRELFTAVRQAMQAAKGQAVIACAQIVQAAGERLNTEKLVAVECLGRVDESLLTGALAAPWATGATLVCGTCETCPHAPGYTAACAVAETTNTLLATWGSAARVRLANKFPAAVRADGSAHTDAARRAFFFRMKDDAQAAAGTVAGAAAAEVLGDDAQQNAPAPRYAKVMADGTLPHHVPSRRQRLLATLGALGTPADDLITTRLWGNVIIDAQTCNSCRMCAVFCPTGALLRTDDAGNFGLDHVAARCVQCRCCESVCPQGAITLSEEVFAHDIATGATEHIALAPPAYHHGDPHATKQVFRTLLNMEDIFDR